MTTPHELFILALQGDQRELIIARLDPCVLRYFVHQKPQYLDYGLIKDLLLEGEQSIAGLLTKIGYQERDMTPATTVRILHKYVENRGQIGGR